MKQLLIILSLVLGCLQPGYTQKPVLKFNKDGKFKIVQFTDVHYIHGNPKSAVSLERINEVLDAEKPDLVLFTGDVIYGQPAEEGMRTILNLAANRQIPFGVTFGNHDDEQGLTRTQLFDIIQTIPYNLTDSVAGVTGVTNFILPLKSSDGKKDAAILYCMDSHSYSQIKGIGGYDYIKFDQIRWYRENSAKYTKQTCRSSVAERRLFLFGFRPGWPFHLERHPACLRPLHRWRHGVQQPEQRCPRNRDD